MMDKIIPAFLNDISFTDILRIDYALEGDWNSTLETIWTKGDGNMGYANIVSSHASYKPSIELYYDGHWIGIHCYEVIDGVNVFDEELANAIVEFVSDRM